MINNEYIGKYHIIKQIGKGGFGKVYLVEYNEEIFALKQLSENVLLPEIIERFDKEAGKIEKLRKDFNLEYLVAIKESLPEHNAFVMEFLKESAEEYLTRTKDYSFIKKLINAIFQLHKIDVVHRDIKPENIRVRDGNPVLIDFGIASWWDSKSNILPGGSRFYSPPEIVAMFPQYQSLEAANLACRNLVEILPDNLSARMKHVKKIHDVFGLGMTIGYLIKGSQPFKTESYEQYLQQGSSKLFDQWLDSIPDEFKDFIKLATEFYPEKRKTLKNLVNTISFKSGNVTEIPENSTFAYTEEPYLCLNCNKKSISQNLKCTECNAPFQYIQFEIQPLQDIELNNCPPSIKLIEKNDSLFIQFNMEDKDFDLKIGRSETKTNIAFSDDNWMSRQQGRIVKTGKTLYYYDGIDGKMPTHLSALNNIPIGNSPVKIMAGAFFLVGSTQFKIHKYFNKQKDK